MKRTNIGLLSLALLAGLGLSSCSLNSRQEVDLKGVEQGSTAKKITFSFVAPRSLPTTYAMIHDQAEWSIKNNSLTLYEFLDDNKFVKVHAVHLIGGNSPEYTAEMSVGDFVGAHNTIYPSRGRRLLFVANDIPLMGLTPGVTTLDEVMSKLFTRSQVAGQSCSMLLQDGSYLPMVGMAKAGGAMTVIPMDQSSTVEVDLIRAVARIDIQTTMSTALNPSYKNLIIKDAVLNRAPATTTVGENKSTGYATVDGVTTFAQIPYSGLRPDQPATPNGVNGKLAKAFYLYESDPNATTKAQAPQLDLTVDYDGKEYHVAVPFVDKNGKVVPVKRNYIYTVILGRDLGGQVPPVTGQNVSFVIAVNDWYGIDTTNGALNLIAPQGGMGMPSQFDPSTRELKISQPGAGRIEIPFASNFSGSANTFKVAVKGNTSWIHVAPDSVGDRVIITSVEPNNTGAERVAVVLVSDANYPAAYSYEFKVVQK